MMFAPLEGWRRVKATDRHAAVDYAEVLKELSDAYFLDAGKIVLVQDNLSTPKRGSWLDMAECELSVLSRQCLDRRIADKLALTAEVAPSSNAATRQGQLAFHPGLSHQSLLS